MRLASLSLPRKATLLSALTALGLVAGKFAVGWFSGSVAVLASAADSFLDFMVSTFNAVAVRSAEKPGDEMYNYGRGKMEGLAAALEGLCILASAAWIAREAFIKLLHPRPLSPAGLGWAMAAMAVSLAITMALVIYLQRVSRASGNLVIEADALHYRTDLVSNAAVLGAMLAIRFTGLNAIDPLLALAVAVYIAQASLPLLRKGLNMLLDRALPDPLVLRIRETAARHSPLVNGVHELKTRRSGETNFVEFHLVFDEQIALGLAHRIADEIEMRIRELDRATWVINIHLDPVDDSKRDQRLSAPRPSSGLLLFVLLLGAAAVAHAGAATTPVGRWKTFDDKTGLAKSIVSIYSVDGALAIRVDSLLPPPGRGADQNKLCDRCPGERKNQRIRGMVVGWGLRPDGNTWDGGRILDPTNGKIYRCLLRLGPAGRTLLVRGYLGISLLGRSQTWQRIE